jgi:hypothetical protein
MGIRFSCPNGHKLNVKNFLAGKRGVCPQCGAKFVIPMPTEESATQIRQPVGIASPSVIIPVSDIDPPPLELEPVIREPNISPAVVPPAIPGTGLPLLVTDAVVATPEPECISLRERSRRNQITISLLLLALVVLLAGVLIWVLQRDVSQTPAPKATAIDRGEFQLVLAMADSVIFLERAI